MSNISKEFEEFAIKINEKIRAAGLLLKEANALREQSGLSSFASYALVCEENEDFNNVLDDYYAKMQFINTDPLFDELEAGGWSVSSMDCPT